MRTRFRTAAAGDARHAATRCSACTNSSSPSPDAADAAPPQPVSSAYQGRSPVSTPRRSSTSLMDCYRATLRLPRRSPSTWALPPTLCLHRTSPGRERTGAFPAWRCRGTKSMSACTSTSWPATTAWCGPASSSSIGSVTIASRSATYKGRFRRSKIRPETPSPTHIPSASPSFLKTASSSPVG